MADFCKDCSDQLFGEGYCDLEGLITEEEVKQGLGASVLCEGCGPILVNHLGERMHEAKVFHNEFKAEFTKPAFIEGKYER
jgi:hypothetical protein